MADVASQRRCVSPLVGQQAIFQDPQPRHPALDRAFRTTTHLGCLLVGQPAGSHQDQRFAPVVTELPEGAAEIAKLEAGYLARQHRRLVGERIVERLNPNLASAQLTAVQATQDGEHPDPQVGSGLERMCFGQGPHDRILHKVVGPLAVLGDEQAKARRWGTRAMRSDSVTFLVS